MEWYTVGWIVALILGVIFLFLEMRAQNRNRKEWMKDGKTC